MDGQLFNIGQVSNARSIVAQKRCSDTDYAGGI